MKSSRRAGTLTLFHRSAWLAVGVAALLTGACSPGSGGAEGTGGANASGGAGVSSGGSTGTGGTVGSSSGGTVGTGGNSSGGAVGTGGGTTSSGGTVGSGGSSSTGGTTGSGGGSATGGSTGSGGAQATGGAGGSADGLRSGPFKMLVLSKCLEFAHDSIATGQQMLRTLGQRTDAQLPKGAQPGSQFTVTIAKDDLSDFSADSLKQYEMIFWVSPTGTVFTSGGTNGTNGKVAIQDFMEKYQGAFGGVHSATDFEKTGKWTWFQDLVGGYFVSHEADGTSFTVVTQPAAMTADHPVIRGIMTPWTVKDEWYRLNRSPETLPNFTILQKLSVDDKRPVTWVKELTGGGRMFYTIRGHGKSVYSEVDFQNLVHQGILWAVHRMK